MPCASPGWALGVPLPSWSTQCRDTVLSTPPTAPDTPSSHSAKAAPVP